MDVDENFYARADEHIELSNEQLQKAPSRGKVSASMMYATARFNAWLSASGHGSGADMAAMREETIQYFCDEYRKALELHLDEYINNFDRYMRPN
ncbi:MULTISPECIES: DUF3144 domain-containing protein [Burkholderia]|uniref:DUF3144 domain-containing protein n=1 Tax=Burkholderia cenocepacia TaxID=95486 RepID=A0A6J5JNP8_9BURK|nr:MULTISPECIES: DUF3144 domain-containing protein [Burkholderia]NIE56377.1 DUF3144 domain-containing protein [Burkholderia sp. Ap-955]NIF08382.1 DUF3144 domain-containing protein [Burkholderia sp. Ax-1735]NIG01036.1 DUF3144 domain-containing protein [Burkholderia sp. Tr-849]CAB3972757.1 hypothetical protein BCO9919_05447 [Burkholderia cenocepacia]